MVIDKVARNGIHVYEYHRNAAAESRSQASSSSCNVVPVEGDKPDNKAQHTVAGTDSRLLRKLVFEHLCELGFEVDALAAPFGHPVDNDDCGADFTPCERRKSWCACELQPQGQWSPTRTWLLHDILLELILRGDLQAPGIAGSELGRSCKVLKVSRKIWSRAYQVSQVRRSPDFESELSVLWPFCQPQAAAVQAPPAR